MKEIKRVLPRKDWKEYYINIAHQVKKKSKDPSTKVGAVIVDTNDAPISFGFNGMPKGADESMLHWDVRELKYLEVVHAEMNAFIFAKRDITGCVVYCTHGPCENCLKHLLAAGVREIYYDDPSIMRDRGTENQKKAIHTLINSTDALVENAITGKQYIKELFNGKEYWK